MRAEDLFPISKTTLAKAQTCILKAALNKIAGLSEPETLPMTQGKRGHELLELGVKGTPFEELKTMERTKKILKWVEYGLGYVENNFSGCDLLTEHHVYCDQQGICEDGKGEIHGIVDLTAHKPGSEEAVVLDYKSGKVAFSPFESHIYGGVIGKALFKECSKITFRLLFLEHRETLDSVYEWQKGRLVVTFPDGTTDRLVDHGNPIWKILNPALEEIRAKEVKPEPGPHCRKWYGRKCQFFGTEHCRPESETLPAQLSEITNPEAYIALKSIYETGVVTQDAARNAWIALSGMKDIVKRIEDHIKKWSKKEGSFTVGNEEIGWHEVDDNTIDKATALQLLLDSDLTTEQIADCISISNTSLKKIPHDYDWLRASIEGFATTPKTKNSFGGKKIS